MSFFTGDGVAFARCLGFGIGIDAATLPGCGIGYCHCGWRLGDFMRRKTDFLLVSRHKFHIISTFLSTLRFQKWTPQLQRNKSSKMIHTQTEKKEKYPNINQTRRKNAHNTFPQDREQIRASCHYGHMTRAVRSCSAKDAFGFLFREEREMCMDCVVR